VRTRIFIDFWNFDIQFFQQRRGTGDRLDWAAVPTQLITGAQATIGKSVTGNLDLQETLVYASYDGQTPQGAKRRSWLMNWLDRQPGVRVNIVERRWRQKPIHCRWCKATTTDCPSCGDKLGRASEKTVDTRIVTEMMRLAWEDAYDVAILVSSDADFIPAVEALQAKNIRVINATWRGRGHQLAAKCWASFELNAVLQNTLR
jgi:uncharacterized LabA/DUF88 family protein